MKNRDLYNALKKPQLYEPGTNWMWTEDHLFPYLLKTHLDETIDIASRTRNNINKTIDWIFSSMNPFCNILDLGCGPGLYTLEYAKKGHRVTGIDISTNSIAYANKISQEQQLNIHYIAANYCDISLQNRYDLITLIFCDFGVLSKQDQIALLKKIYSWLEDGGECIIDCYNLNMWNSLTPFQNFEIEEKGFWRPHPYISFESLFLYKEQNAFLSQHVVVDDEISIYRFYNHIYSEEMMKEIFALAGFQTVEVANNIISDDTVTFYRAKK